MPIQSTVEVDSGRNPTQGVNRWLSAPARRRLAIAWDLVPLTFLGVLVIAASVTFLWVYGLGTSDYVLLAGCTLALSWVAMNILAVWLGAFLLHRSLKQAASTFSRVAETDTPLRTGFCFSRLKRLPLVYVRVEWVSPIGVTVTLKEQTDSFLEEIVAHTRGRSGSIERRLIVSGLFGLTRFAFRHREDRRLEIAPAKGRFHFSLALRNTSGEGFSHPKGEPVGEYVDMRRYAHGDPLRYIIWKAYARTRRLLVRTPERALTPKPSMVAYLIAGEADDEAASTARLFVEDGLLGEDAVFSAEGAPGPARNVSDALGQIISSVEHRSESGAGLDRFLGQVNPHQLGHCVIFAPREPGPWVESVARFSKSLPAPATVVLSADVAQGEAERSGWGRFFFADSRREDNHRPALLTLQQELVSRGLDVKILHTESGEELTLQQLQALEAS